jgi:hypothetical protein
MTLIPSLARPVSAAVTNPNPVITTTLFGPKAVTKDTYFTSAFPATNYGSNQFLQYGTDAGAVCGTFPGGTPPGCVLLIQLNLTSIPSNAVIVSAVVYLWDIAATGPSQSEMERVTTSWSESTVTYNTQPSTTSFNQKQGIPANSQWTYVPVYLTNMVTGWMAGTFTNYGFEMIPASTAGPFQFYSKEATYPDSQIETVIQYQLPVATVYPAYYCSGGPCETNVISGSGLPAYLFSVFYSENNGTLRRAIRPDLIPTNLTTWFRLQVKDFFGNILYDANKSVNSWQYPWLVAIPYGILQAYNMRDGVTSLTITPTGGTAANIDLMPRAWWALPLKSSVSYYLNFSLLDAKFNVVGTVNIVQVMGQKLSYIVNGTTLTQVAVNQNNLGLTINSTYGVSTGVGNVLLAPHGIDLFYAYYTAALGPVKIGLSLWLVLVFLMALASGAFAYAYRGKLPYEFLKWPRRAKLVIGFFFLPMGTILIVSLIIFASGGQAIIPVPWLPLPAK